MNVVYEILVALHIVGVVAIGYGFFSQISKEKKEINPGLLHGASLQLLTGVLMVGLRESGVVSDEEELNMTKISIKLAVVLALMAVAILGKKTTKDVKPYWLAAGALWLINIIVAVAM